MLPIKIFETDEQEAARLAASQPGSKNHLLSQLPITLQEDPTGLLLKLPSNAWSQYHLIVFVNEREPRRRTVLNEEGLRERRDTFETVVVASNHPDYPVGGYRLMVGHTELRRSTKVELDPVQPVPGVPGVPQLLKEQRHNQEV